MDIVLKSRCSKFKVHLDISGSKSESNRALLLQAIYPNLKIENLSNSDDTQLMQEALSSSESSINIHHAGTAMRFLTAYFSTQTNKEIILTGSQRMQERPIKILVEALLSIGADINYKENEGFPPLIIKGKTPVKNTVTIDSQVSSQYISALVLIAPKLPKGLEIKLTGKLTSLPYLQMSVELLNQVGINATLKNQIISIAHTPKVENTTIMVESDWSSASYYYSIVSMSDIGSEIGLSTYKQRSLQGDNVLSKIYSDLGVKTTFEKNTMYLKKVSEPKLDFLKLDLLNSPDIAQTIVVNCFGLGLKCHLTGLHTLKIKETDRLEALKTELQKLGASVQITDSSISLEKSSHIEPNISIETYHDHRMAMAFAPLCIKAPIKILEAQEVSKSYPNFWKDLETFLI